MQKIHGRITQETFVVEIETETIILKKTHKIKKSYTLTSQFHFWNQSERNIANFNLHFMYKD